MLKKLKKCKNLYISDNSSIGRQSEDDSNKEISRRISAGWNAFNKSKQLLISRRVPAHLKKKYFHRCVLPAMLYASETWALTKTEETRLAVAQRHMERRMLNVRLIDRHPREWLRERTQLKNVVQLSRERKFKYLRKLMLLPNDRWNHVLTQWVPNVNRPAAVLLLGLCTNAFYLLCILSNAESLNFFNTLLLLFVLHYASIIISIKHLIKYIISLLHRS